MSKAFKAYGFDLRDYETDVKLNIPTSFKATYNYHKAKTVNIESNLENGVDKILGQV